MLIFNRIHVGIYAINDVFSFYEIVGTKQSIPDRKYIAVVTVCIRLGIMMMRVVHVWAYNDVTYGLVQPTWK